MEHPICQQRSFVVCGDWNMTPPRFQEEAKSWLTEMQAQVLAPTGVAATRAGSTVPDSVMSSSCPMVAHERTATICEGAVGAAHWASTEQKQGTLGRATSHGQETCERALWECTRCQCHDGDSDLVSDGMSDVVQNLVSVMFCVVGSLYAGWSLSAERCPNLIGQARINGECTRLKNLGNACCRRSMSTEGRDGGDRGQRHEGDISRSLRNP